MAGSETGAANPATDMPWDGLSSLSLAAAARFGKLKSPPQVWPFFPSMLYSPPFAIDVPTRRHYA